MASGSATRGRSQGGRASSGGRRHGHRRGKRVAARREGPGSRRRAADVVARQRGQLSSGVRPFRAPERAVSRVLPDGSAKLTQLAPASAPAAVDAGDLIFDASLGGSLDDTGYWIAVDSAGNSYITGLTRSTNLPVTPGAYDPTNESATRPADAFAAKLNAAGSSFIYVTYLGGTGREAGFGIAVDGNLAFVAGETNSPDFAGTTGSGDSSGHFRGRAQCNRHQCPIRDPARWQRG